MHQLGLMNLESRAQDDHRSWRSNPLISVLWHAIFVSAVCVDEFFGIRILDGWVARALAYAQR
jgi:hypothetical protein